MNIFDFNLPVATRDALIEAADILTPEPKRAAAISLTFVSGGGPAAAFALINLGELRMSGQRRAGYVAAEKRFRSSIAISDTIGEAHAGLGLAIDRQTGRAAEAEASYARAVELMEADAQRARRRWRQRRRNSHIKDDFSERAVEAMALRYLLVCAACLCELRHERGAVQESPLDQSLFEWAVKNEEVLDDGYGMDNGTWMNFHWACSRVRALTGRVDAVMRGLRRAVSAGQISEREAADLTAGFSR